MNDHKTTYQRHSSSFRDPSGFVFWRENGTLYRQVNVCYREQYDHLMHSGLYEHLIAGQLLIPHKEIDLQSAASKEAYRVIQPERVPFISYPYEWCFSQLKDAALLTLKIQRKAIECGMALKDASAYNVQFFEGRPIWIDTLSFEIYQKERPWVAYRQFCQHFLAPLALMSLQDIRLNQLLRIYMDGIPLDLAASLLPFHAHLRFGLLLHIYLHNQSQKYFSNKTPKKEILNNKFNQQAMLGLINSLESSINRLKWRPQGTEWANYEKCHNYKSESAEHKKRLVAAYLDKVKPKTLWDFGANTGVFSRIAASKRIKTIAFDIDPAAVEKNYLFVKKNSEKNLLPLLLDLTNPSPAIGWDNKERFSFEERGPVDTILTLALVHHLAISNNLPLEKIALFLSKLCQSLIIEFIPKNDFNVQKLLATREDIFSEYTINNFEAEFKKYFSYIGTDKISDSERVLYCMRRR